MNITIGTNTNLDGAVSDAIQTWAERSLREAHGLTDELTDLADDVTVTFRDSGIHLSAVITVVSAHDPKPEAFQAVVQGATMTDLICSILEGDWLDADKVTERQIANVDLEIGMTLVEGSDRIFLTDAPEPSSLMPGYLAVDVPFGVLYLDDEGNSIVE